LRMLLKIIGKFKGLRVLPRRPMAGSQPLGAKMTTAQRTQTIAAASLGIALLVLGLKFLAWYFTGSIALYSDALESIVNVVTSISALIAVRLAQRPADAALPYGYHKAEYFSAVLVGVMIIVAAILI